MGCFNSACSLSHLDVKSGDKCYFLILKPNKYQNNTEGSTHCYTDDRYKLFCFPIIGEYDDYGGLEEIEKDEHILFLEKKLKMPIESLIQIATETRGVYDHFSEKFKLFIKNEDILNYSETLLDIMKKMKFESVEENKYLVNTDLKLDSAYTIEIVSKDKFNIFKNGVYLSSHFYNYPSDFFEDFQKTTGIYLNIKNRKIFDLVKDICSCFVLKDIADELMRNKKMYEHWYYTSINDWDFTPAVATQIGFKEVKFGKYRAEKDGQEFLLEYFDNPKIGKKKVEKVKDLKFVTKLFQSELKELEKQTTWFDCSCKNFILGAKAKFSLDVNECSYYFENFYRNSIVFNLNTIIMEMYCSEFRDWRFEKEYTLAEKIVYLFLQTHNMLAPTCNATQDDMRDNLMILYKVAINWTKRKKKEEEEW